MRAEAKRFFLAEESGGDVLLIGEAADASIAADGVERWRSLLSIVNEQLKVAVRSRDNKTVMLSS